MADWQSVLIVELCISQTLDDMVVKLSFDLHDCCALLEAAAVES